MKKSNKLSLFYILSSVAFLLSLIIGGFYGVYVSVGMNFVRNGISNLTEGGGATNVSFGGQINFQRSMMGIIILSVALIIISILDFISFIKQITFFKQFAVIRDSGIVKSIEGKSKGKGKIVFFATAIDVVSFFAGIIGIFLNIKTFPGGNGIWTIYVFDALISILAVINMTLLFSKLKKLKKSASPKDASEKTQNRSSKAENFAENSAEFEKIVNFNVSSIDIDEIEYKLLKLRQLRSSRIITRDEFEYLRKFIVGGDDYKLENVSESQPKHVYNKDGNAGE